MNAFLLSVFVVALFLVPLLLPVGLLYFWRNRLTRSHRSPLTRMLLRAPGESLRNELEDARLDFFAKLSVLSSLPLLLFAGHLSQSYFLGTQESPVRTGVLMVIGVGGVVYLLLDVYRQIQRISKLRQGYEGEVAVAQELSMLMHEGAFVFHDVPAEGFNIDHVIVWPKGIYAVETKIRMKPRRDQGADDARVEFDGRQLKFPGWTESAPLDQASRQAKWLGQWLSSAVGEKLAVKPVLALPGWYVELKSKGDVLVINGKNAPTIFGKLFSSDLSGEMVLRIAHQLEQRCRDVEPAHFHKRDRIS